MVSDEKLQDWRAFGKSVGAEIKITPEPLTHIDARGFLAHQLTHIIGGHLEYIKTSWRQPILKILERFFPVMPICRWVPPYNSVLEQVGRHSQNDVRAYRLKRDNQEPLVFFVEYEPESSIAGTDFPSLYKLPKLDFDNVLQAPFLKSDEANMYTHEINIGLWEELSK